MKLAEIENALIALVEAALPGVTVQTAASQHFDDEGNILAIPPAVLVIYAGGQGEARDVRGLTYEAHPRWMLAAGASNLRGALEEQQGDAVGGLLGAYDLLDALRALAGKILNLTPSGGLLVWRGDELLQHDNDGTWYAVMFELATAFVNAE
jgi:phage gp37-like protein